MVSDGLAHLAKHDTVQDKLIEEIKEHCESGEIHQETLNQMEYLDAVVNEMLRYCGPVSMQSREIKSPVKFNNDFEIKASQDLPVTVLILLRNINFDKAIWGDDAQDFKPERFMKENINSSKQINVASFSHGPRACIGKNLAKISMKTELIYLFRDFKLECEENLENREMSEKVITQFKTEPLISIKSHSKYFR